MKSQTGGLLGRISPFHSLLFLLVLLEIFPASLRAQVDPPPTPAEVKIVLVENSDLGPGENRLHYPLLLNNGIGFRIKCLAQTDEEKVIRGLGFLSMPSVVLDPLSDEVVNANLEEQPFLCPYSATNYKIKLYRHNPGTGEQFYLHFPTALNDRGYGDSLYIAGCSQLVSGLNLKLDQAINADPTPFFQDKIFKIDCFNGSPITVAPKTFNEWCMKKDLTPAQSKTVTALLAYSPFGTSALGNEDKCRESDEFLSSLPTLNLSNQQLVDIGPLAVFKSLTQLLLNNNQITDIAPLAQLRAITNLNLSQNKIQNVSALAGFTNLGDLNLSGNTVSDIRPLSALMNLKKLNLSSNGVGDSLLSSLAFMANLKELLLSRNSITDPRALAEMTGLEKLDLSYNKIASTAVIAGFKTGTTINWEGNPFISGGYHTYYEYCTLAKFGASVPSSQLTTLRTIEDLMKAQNVNPQDCRAASDWVKSATTLNLANKGLADLFPLSFFTNLRSLDLTGNQVTNVSPLKGLSQLRKLYLNDNGVVDVEPIAECSNLERLMIARNQIVSSFSLGRLNKLTVVDLRDNKIRGLDKIKRLLERSKDRGALNGRPVGVYLNNNHVCSENYLVIPTGNPILDRLQEHNKKLNLVKAKACTEMPLPE